MKEKLEALQGMVKREILKSNFKVVKRTPHEIRINVYGFRFSLWSGNGSEYLETYEGSYNTMALEFTDVEKTKIWKILQNDIGLAKKDQIKELEEKKEQLEKQLNALKQ